MGRASKIMAPTSCFNGQVHRLPDAPEAYGAMITRPMAAPAQSRSADLVGRCIRHVFLAAGKGQPGAEADGPEGA